MIEPWRSVDHRELAPAGRIVIDPLLRRRFFLKVVMKSIQYNDKCNSWFFGGLNIIGVASMNTNNAAGLAIDINKTASTCLGSERQDSAYSGHADEK